MDDCCCFTSANGLFPNAGGGTIDITATSNQLIDYTNYTSNINYNYSSNNSNYFYNSLLLNSNTAIGFSNQFLKLINSNADGVYFNNISTKTRINNNGIINVYHTSNILVPDEPDGWWDVEDKLTSNMIQTNIVKFDLTLLNSAITSLTTLISTINGLIASLEASDVALTVSMALVESQIQTINGILDDLNRGLNYIAPLEILDKSVKINYNTEQFNLIDDSNLNIRSITQAIPAGRLTYTNAILNQIDDNTAYLKYIEDGTITFPISTVVDFLVVGAGGRGGAGYYSGGGGGGEVIYKTSHTFASGTYSITIGKDSDIANTRITKIHQGATNYVIAKGGGDGGFYDKINSSILNYYVYKTITARVNDTNNYTLNEGGHSLIFANGNVAVNTVIDTSYPIIYNNVGAIRTPYVWYKFDTTAYSFDSGTKATNFTNVGSVNDTTIYLRGNGSASFNGSSQYINTTMNVSLGAMQISLGLSFSFWVYLKSTSNTSSHIFNFDNGTGASRTTYMTFGKYTDGIQTGLLFQVIGSGTTINLKTNNAINYFNNKWYYITITFSTSGNVKFYLNNVLITTGSGNIPNIAWNNTYIGGGITNNYFNGNIDDFRIYQKELTTNEITDLYNGFIIINDSPTSGGSGGGGTGGDFYANQSGANSGSVWNASFSTVANGSTGTLTEGGNGGGTGYIEVITGNDLVLGKGGLGNGDTNYFPNIKNDFGEGGDGLGGYAYQGVIIIKAPYEAPQTTFTGFINWNKINSVSVVSPFAVGVGNQLSLTYDSSLTKVGNNLSVVKTATQPLVWTGNDISLNYDSTLTKVGNNLSVASATGSKWTTSGNNIYNNNTANVGIGSLLPQEKLDVNGNAFINGIATIGVSKINPAISSSGGTGGASLILVPNSDPAEYYQEFTLGGGTIVLSEPCSADILCVGAGGNGGTGASSGGGGAGEVIYYPNFPLRAGTLNIQVGASGTNTTNRISRIYPSSGNELMRAKGGGDGGYLETITSTATRTITLTATALINYINSFSLTAGSYTATFATGAITLTGFSADKSYPILKDGSGNTIQPRAWYKFDVGALLTDSGSVGSFTLVNGFNVSNNTSSFVKGDASANLNGTDNFYYGGGGGSWNINGVDFTVAFWSYRTANNVNMSLFQFGNIASVGRRLICFYQSDNKLNWGLYGKENPTTNGYADANSWVHLVFAFNHTNKTIKYYYNGALIDTITTVNATTNFDADNWIGYSVAFSRHNGRIDDFRIYLSELTATQASELYSGRVDITYAPLSGGSGGGGYKSQTGANAGSKFDEYKSFVQAGLNGNSTTGGNGGSGSSLYNTRFTTTITGSSLSVSLGGSGVSGTPTTPATKTNYGDGGDGNGGVGYGGLVIVRFKANTNYLQVKAIKNNGNSGIILNANETVSGTTTPYQLKIYPFQDTYTSTSITTRGYTFQTSDGITNTELLNLFSFFGGRIGIKTRNPASVLDVNGDIACKTFNVVGNEEYGITCQIVNQHATGEASLGIYGGQGTSYGGLALYYLPSQNLGYISCSKNLKIKTGNDALSSYIYMDDTTGNVGIGITTPSSKLEVIGDIHSTSSTALTGNFNTISTSSLALNNGNITGVNKITSVELETGPIKSGAINLQGSGITNGGTIQGTCTQARFLLANVNEWHYSQDNRNRFYFTDDGTSSHTVFRTGSTTHYFQDKDATDYCLLDRFGISTYFEVISGGGYDNIGVLDASVTGVYVYRRLLVRLSTFTEVHRCFCEDELFLNYDEFINNYIGRVVVSKGKIKTALKEADKEWQILEGKDGITIDDNHPVVELSRKKKDKRVIGVITKRNNSADMPNRLVINSLGETAIWVVNTNGNLENGDLITTSDELGYGEKQDCDFIKNYTIGKIMIDCNFELDSPNYKCEVIDAERDLRRAFLPIFIYSG